jgi:hypothetical protein
VFGLTIHDPGRFAVARPACRTRSANTSAALDDFPVGYSFLWRAATTDIASPEALAFAFPKA